MTLSTETTRAGFAAAKRRASWLVAQPFRGYGSVTLAPDGGTVPDPYGAAAGAVARVRFRSPTSPPQPEHSPVKVLSFRSALGADAIRPGRAASRRVGGR